jgi:hypothetical protein
VKGAGDRFNLHLKVVPGSLFETFVAHQPWCRFFIGIRVGAARSHSTCRDCLSGFPFRCFEKVPPNSGSNRVNHETTPTRQGPGPLSRSATSSPAHGDSGKPWPLKNETFGPIAGRADGSMLVVSYHPTLFRR